jgi:hypothetical protein
MKKAIALVLFALALEGALVLTLAIPAGAPSAAAAHGMAQARVARPGRS